MPPKTLLGKNVKLLILNETHWFYKQWVNIAREDTRETNNKTLIIYVFQNCSWNLSPLPEGEFPVLPFQRAVSSFGWNWLLRPRSHLAVLSMRQQAVSLAPQLYTQHTFRWCPHRWGGCTGIMNKQDFKLSSGNPSNTL